MFDVMLRTDRQLFMRVRSPTLRCNAHTSGLLAPAGKHEAYLLGSALFPLLDRGFQVVQLQLGQCHAVCNCLELCSAPMRYTSRACREAAYLAVRVECLRRHSVRDFFPNFDEQVRSEFFVVGVFQACLEAHGFVGG